MTQYTVCGKMLQGGRCVRRAGHEYGQCWAVPPTTRTGHHPDCCAERGCHPDVCSHGRVVDGVLVCSPEEENTSFAQETGSPER